MLMLAFSGCANIHAPLGVSQAETVQQRLANDFPFPQGARVDNDRSIVLGGGSAWTGRVMFSVSSTPTDMFDFYREQLPAAGWQTISLIKAKTSILTFIKQDRSATIEINDSMSGTTVGVTMSPRIDNTAPSPTPAATGASSPSTTKK